MDDEMKVAIPDAEESKDMSKWECEPCGYIYDPAIGDPDGGIEPGTSFDDIPEDWVCPMCGVDKSMFIRVEEDKAQDA